MKYKLIEEFRAQDLNTIVQRYLDEGWEPYGQPFSTHKDSMISQAIIYTPPKTKRAAKE